MKGQSDCLNFNYVKSENIFIIFFYLFIVINIYSVFTFTLYSDLPINIFKIISFIFRIYKYTFRFQIIDFLI